MEVTGRKDVKNGGRSILKMTSGFGLFSSLSKVKIYFFLLFTSNLSYFNRLPFSFNNFAGGKALATDHLRLKREQELCLESLLVKRKVTDWLRKESY